MNILFAEYIIFTLKKTFFLCFLIFTCTIAQFKNDNTKIYSWFFDLKKKT